MAWAYLPKHPEKINTTQWEGAAQIPPGKWFVNLLLKLDANIWAALGKYARVLNICILVACLIIISKYNPAATDKINTTSKTLFSF